MKILVPNSIPLQLDVSGEIVEYDIRADIPEEHCDADVLVDWGADGQQLLRYAQQLRQVRLVQSLLAGPDNVLKAGFRPEAILCSGVGLHDRTVAEHAMALALCLVRKIPGLLEAKQEHRWAREFAGRQPLHTRPVTTFLDAKVLIWGFGSIAKELARLLHHFGAEVRGVARSAGQRDGFTVVTEEDLDQELAECDILFMILPNSEDTVRALDENRLQQLPEHAFVINVGRGTTVDEAALLRALEQGQIAGAALDVMWQEPLPADSPLWDGPNLILTPHNAGGRPVEADSYVTAQIKAFQEGRELRNRVR